MIVQYDPITWFVNREDERKKFQRIISGESRQRIMTIQSGPGMGKTWLIKHFGYECHCRELPYANVDFGTGIQYDYLKVMFSIRDNLGERNFVDFTSLTSQYYSRLSPAQGFPDRSSSSAVEIHSALRRSGVDNVAGRDIFRDNNFYFAGGDMSDELRQRWRSDLTSAFKKCLRTMNDELPTGKWIVWQFDSFEKIDPLTREWLINEFLSEIKEQTLSRLVVIIAGQDVPSLSFDWKSVAAQYTLGPWSLNDYQEYVLGKAKMPLEPNRIKALHKRYNGRPLDLAMWVDAASPMDDED